MAAAATLTSLSQIIPASKGYDDIDHRVFLVTNEYGSEKTLQTLKTQKIVGNVLMGVSGFFLLNIASIRGTLSESDRTIEQIVLCDRSIRVEHFWKMIQKIIPLAQTRVDFILCLNTLLKDNIELYFNNTHGIPPEQFRAELMGDLIGEFDTKESWLSDDIKFQRVRNFFITGAFTFLRLDLTDTKACDLLKLEFSKRNYTVDTFYLSNVRDYLTSQKQLDDAATALTGIISPQTLVVHTHPRSSSQPTLRQRVIRLNQSPVKSLFTSEHLQYLPPGPIDGESKS